MPTQISENQAKYFEVLRIKALEQALTNPDKLFFDPQGRILIDVSLEAADLNKLGKGSMNFVATPTTTVSFDVADNNILRNAFKNKLINAGANVDAIDAYLKLNTSSVIALQQEMQLHLLGAQRVLTEKAFANQFSNKDQEINQATLAALEQVNQIVINNFAAMLNANTSQGQVDIASLNKSLDKARANIAPQAIYLLLKHLKNQTGVELTQADIKNLKSEGKSLKHLASSTTATKNDILHIDAQQGLATLIRGSEFTAHERKLTSTLKAEKTSFAHRQIITHQYSHGTITASENSRIQIRTPSPVIKLKDERNYYKKMRNIFKTNPTVVADVVLKFKEIEREYDLSNNIQQHDTRRPKAFVYNRYTAIGDYADDLKGVNQQTESSMNILNAMHKYNTENIKQGIEMMMFVQNISVNGFGKNLSYNSSNLIRESTLMSEIALLHSGFDELNDDQKEHYSKIIANYQRYLLLDDKPEYFSSHELGNETIQLIQEIKSQIKKQEPPQNSEDVTINAKRALLQLMAHNKHMKHEYAKTVQTLSVFTEEVSIGGCKSGNERAQAINGRVAILDSLTLKDSDKYTADDFLLKSSIQQLASGQNFNKAAKVFNKQLHTAYNMQGLHSAASLISNSDQFASAKVQSRMTFSAKFLLSPTKILKWLTSKFNTNFAEEASLSNLAQSKAGKMQAHKGFTRFVEQAVSENPSKKFKRSLKELNQKLNSSALKILKP